MLRMRPKPPASMPHINSGKPWSIMDLQDLHDFLRQHMPVEKIADFLSRDVHEVEAKMAKIRRVSGYH